MDESLLRYLLFLLPFVPYSYTQNQNACNNARSASLRITCQQINNWAAQTRNVAVPSIATVSSPGFAGLAGPVAISSVATSTTPTSAYDCMDIACLCGFFGGTGEANCVLPNGQTLTKATRKEYRVMTDDERQRYHTAMWSIKGNGDYDAISVIHSQFATSPGAHSGPAFLLWHREFIKRIEIALRRIDPTLGLPYWDSTLDETLPSSKDSVLWGNELMGTQSSDGTVRTGAFRNWTIVDYVVGTALARATLDVATRAYEPGVPHEKEIFVLYKGSRVLRRDIGAIGDLLTESDVSALLNTNDFRQILAFTAPQQSCPFPADISALEYTHGAPHVYTGGDMQIITTAANDPLFFNHHSMIDLIWEQWRLTKQSRSERETVYPQDNLACSSTAHFLNNTMAPFFPKMNRDGLSNQYTDNLYQYAPRPTCTTANLNGCGSKYLFCDVSHGSPRCAAKIVLGGNCGGYTNNEDRCYLGQCTNNICSVVPTPMPTTQPPIVTTSSPTGPRQETCYNEQQCCAPWAARGECSRNPVYMNLWCRASCAICIPRTYDLSVECSNRTPRCMGWARMGDCRNNPSWMSENCRLACNLCGQTRAQTCATGTTSSSTVTITTTSTTSTSTTTSPIIPQLNNTCINQHYCCIAWASRGYCTTSDYRDYMALYCQAACLICTGSPFGSIWNTQACNDGNQACRQWTAQNQCSINPAYMWENCRQSCSACNIGMLPERLRSCGFSRRLTSRRRPISAFHISPVSLSLPRRSLLSRRTLSLAPGLRVRTIKRTRHPTKSSNDRHGPNHPLKKETTMKEPPLKNNTPKSSSNSKGSTRHVRDLVVFADIIM